MTKITDKITGILLILLGVYLLFAADIVYGLVVNSLTFQCAAMIYCAISFYFYFDHKKHIKTFLSAFVFNTAVVLFAVNNYEIIKIEEVIIYSVLIIPGISFIFLFLSDMKYKLFLYLTIGWICAGFLVIEISPRYLLLYILSNFLNVFFSTLPILLIALGVVNLLKQKHHFKNPPDK